MSESDIRIRHLEPGDYRAIHRLFEQPKAVRGTLQLPFPSVETWRQRLADKPDDLFALVACAREEEVVGLVGLELATRSLRRRHAAEIGITVHDDWQGHGVGTALLGSAVELADRWLNLTRLELIVNTDNAAAIRLYEKFGFVVEGTLQSYSFRDGAFADAYTMARVR